MKKRTKMITWDSIKDLEFEIIELNGLENEGVRWSNQGVRSSNQGVRSSNQGVRSSNEGVRSSNEGVRWSNEGVRWSNQGVRSFGIFTEREQKVSPMGIGREGSGCIILMSTSVDFIPGGGAEFDNWQKNFVIKVNSFISGWSISDDGLAEWANLTGTGNKKQQRWTDAWAKVSSKQFTHADEVEMLAARKSYESGIKADPADTSIRIWVTRYVRNNKKVTPEQKSQCRLTVPKDGATATNPDTVKAMLEAEMVISVKDSKHLLHLLKITQNKKSVAAGADVSEISVYIAITAADVRVSPDIKDFDYDGAAKRGLYAKTFDASLEGMRAWYITRKKYKGKTKKLGTPSVATTAIII